MRKIDGGARHHALHGPQRRHRRRRDPLQGPRHEHARRRGAAPHPRRRDRHGLSRADGGVEPEHDRRTAAHRGAGSPRGDGRGGGAKARPSGPRRRTPARCRAHHGRLSPPALGRPAAARGHRDGADEQALAVALGRADDGARRNRRGRHRRPDPRYQPQVRHRAPLHLAQPRPHRRGLRPRLRDVLGRGGRGGRHRRGVRGPASSLHPRPVRLYSAAGGGQERTTAGAHPRATAAAARAPAGVQLRAAVRPLSGRAVRRPGRADGGGRTPRTLSEVERDSLGRGRAQGGRAPGHEGRRRGARCGRHAEVLPGLRSLDPRPHIGRDGGDTSKPTKPFRSQPGGPRRWPSWASRDAGNRPSPRC